MRSVTLNHLIRIYERERAREELTPEYGKAHDALIEILKRIGRPLIHEGCLYEYQTGGTIRTALVAFSQEPISDLSVEMRD